MDSTFGVSISDAYRNFDRQFEAQSEAVKIDFRRREDAVEAVIFLAETIRRERERLKERQQESKNQKGTYLVIAFGVLWELVVFGLGGFSEYKPGFGATFIVYGTFIFLASLVSVLIDDFLLRRLVFDENKCASVWVSAGLYIDGFFELKRHCEKLRELEKKEQAGIDCEAEMVKLKTRLIELEDLRRERLFLKAAGVRLSRE